MEFAPVTKNVELFGITESKKMSIAATGKVFYAFISGLYSRKIEAVVRESCANALDGHINRGNVNEPFLVHCPTMWEPFYSVRDYGSSMDHDFVMALYSTIGFSSKEKSNSEVGTWGFGSKSPFAYTSQFTLTCWQNGMQRVYNLHLDGSGEPSVALMSTLPSTEPQGCCVSFDVRGDDIDNFRDEVIRAGNRHAQGFMSNISAAKPAPRTFETAHFFETPMTHGEGPFVEIGCVWYEIDFRQLPVTSASRRLESQRSLVIKSPIGLLAVPPSRETLEYTDKTKKGLQSLFQAIDTQAVDESEALVKTFTSLWEAATYDQTSIKSFLTRIELRETATPWGKHGDLYSIPASSVNNVKRVVLQGDKVITTSASTMTREKGVMLFLQDGTKEQPKRLPARIVNALKNAGMTTGYVVTKPDATASIRAMSLRLRKKEGLERKQRKRMIVDHRNALEAETRFFETIADQFACPAVLDTLTLPDAPALPTKMRPIHVYKLRSKEWKFQPYRTATEDLEEGACHIVVPIVRRGMRAGLSEISIRLAARHIGLTLGMVTGVSQSSVATFLKHHPAYRLIDDVFNAETIDAAALCTRLKMLEWESSAAPSEGMLEKIESHLPRADWPPILQHYSLLIREAAERYSNDKGVGQHLKSDGPCYSSCKTMLELIGHPMPRSKVKDYEAEADAALQSFYDAYPHVRAGLNYWLPESYNVQREYFGAAELYQRQAVWLHEAQLAA